MGTRIVLAGCGNMGFAMLKGWLGSGEVAPTEVFVAEPNGALAERAAALGVQTGAGADALPTDAAPELVVVAVKPQVIRDAITGYRRFGNGTTTFLSVAAGTAMATFSEILGEQTPVMRCMPNTPAAVGKGMLVTVTNGLVPQETEALVATLLAASGEVAAVSDEALIDAVTAVSGSGPAYVFLFIECLTKAGEAAGLPSETAAQLARQTVWGAAALAKESGEDPAELRRQVTSPNGTTAAALDVLMGDDRLQALVTEAVAAAHRRAIELAKG